MTPHHRAVISTFLVSFANFSTIGMIIGTLKGIVDKKTSDFVSKYVPMMLLAGILVSLLTLHLLDYLLGNLLLRFLINIGTLLILFCN